MITQSTMIRKGFAVTIGKEEFAENRPYFISISPRGENSYTTIQMSKDELRLVRDKINEFLQPSKGNPIKWIRKQNEEFDDWMKEVKSKFVYTESVSLPEFYELIKHLDPDGHFDGLYGEELSTVDGFAELIDNSQLNDN